MWDSPAWDLAETLELSHFRPEGSDHTPRTSVRLLYNDQGIYCMFRVEDRYIRCRHTGYMDPVYKDSCVEFFVQPKPDKGYFNFEFNCGGVLLCSYIIDPARTDGRFRDFAAIPEEQGKQVIIQHSMPRTVEPEIEGPAVWLLETFIPFSLLEKYAGPTGRVKGQSWRANFYKCGDETSHPHWASWTRLPEKNFHLPGSFGSIRFD
jgi:hypothetical protein